MNTKPVAQAVQLNFWNLEQIHRATLDGIAKVQHWESKAKIPPCEGCGSPRKVDVKATVKASMKDMRIVMPLVVKFEDCQECFVREVLMARGCPKAMAHSSFDNWIPEGAEQVETLETVRAFARETSGVLILSSPRPGVGKTHLAVAAMRENRNRSWFVSHPELATPKEWGKAEQLERRARGTPFLVLDDLGLGSERGSDHASLERIIYERHAEELQTVITTNLCAEKLGEWLGPRNKDRVMQHLFRFVTINGISKRKQNRRHLRAG